MNVRSAVQVGLRLLWVSFLVLTVIPSVANLSAQSFRGGIRGEVTDPHGLHVAGAKVVARNLGTSESREVTADEQGEFRFVELPAGDYEVSAVATGLEEAHISPVRVDVGVETIADVTLTQLKSRTESVEVVETVPIVETANTTLSQVVDRKLVQELPLNGRDFGKLVALTPGVTVEGSGVAGTEKGFGQFNINGNRDRSNNYTLDGTDNNDPWFNNSALNQVGITGAPATLLPLDAIQEFNLQSQFSAEYGRNSGSIVNIVTRSGSNFFHGSLYEYNRNSAFDARNYFNTKINPATNGPNPQSHFNNNNFGGSLGGPIIKDRTFFFLAYEGQRERVGSDFALTVPTAGEVALAEQEAAANTAILPNGVNQALVKILNAYMPTSPTNSLPATVSDKNDNDNFIVKVDHRFNEVNSIAVRYAFGNDDQVFPLGSLGGFGSGSRLGSFAQISPTRVQVVSASWLAVISPSLFNEVRFGYSRFSNSFNSADGNLNTESQYGINFGTGLTGLPEFDFNGFTENLGATTFGIPRGRTSQTYQILDDFTYIHGRQSWKFGGEYRRALVDFSNDNFARGIFSFTNTPAPPVTVPGADDIVNTLANYFLGNGSVSAVTGNTARNLATNGLSFFAQNDIRVNPNFTLNAGLRWEYYGPVSEAHNLMSNLLSPTGTLVMVGTAELPIPYTRDLNNFGPRLGFAWNVLPKTVMRSAYGIYYDYIPMHLMQANFTNSAGISANPIGPQAVVPLNYNQDAYNGTTPGPVFTPVPPVLPSIFATDHNLRTPYVQSWNLNLQREISSTFAIEAAYVGSKGTRLVRLYNLNQNAINPFYSSIDVLSTGTSSTYEGGQLTVRLQNWHRFSGFSTYTYSKSLDGASDGINYDFAFVALPQDSTNLKAEKGPSSFDTRHRWTTAMNYQIPTLHGIGERFAAGWQLNSIITVQSGRPIDIATTSTTAFGGNQRPDVVPGQPFVLPNWNPLTGYLNPAAFATPANAEGLGNLGRDRVYGYGFWNVDFSISKNTKLWENAVLQFRAEIFNIVNHPNFALPSLFVTPGSTSAGAITQTPDVAQGNPGLGGGGPRVMQFGLRLQF